MHKLVIGSANFYNKYGIDNTSFKNSKNLKIIFNEIKKSKIRYLDTAINYKIEKTLPKSTNLNNLKITTKIKLPNRKKKNYILNLNKKINTYYSKRNIYKKVLIYFISLILRGTKKIKDFSFGF